MAMPRRYTLPTELATEFTPDEVNEFRNQFGLFDANGDGSIDTHELETVLRNLGENVSANRLNELIAEVDRDENHKVEWNEFMYMMKNIREGGHSAMAQVVKKAAKLLLVEGAGGAQHTFSEEEKIAFTEHINNCLSNDPHVGARLPMDPNTMAVFENCSDGLILCKLINLAEHDTVDVRALNTRANLNVYQKTENLNLAINAAKSIGCQVTNVGAGDLLEARPILILGLLWQIIRIQLLSSISLKNFPELVLLLNEGEELEALLKLPPEEILLRWFNYHLAQANHPRRVTNFGNDLKDSDNYSALLHQLSPSQCPPVTAEAPRDRAAQVIANARAMGVATFIQPKDIADGNRKLNLGFVAQLFNSNPGLSITQEQLEEYDFAPFELDDAGDSREERVFRMWVNSLAIPDLYLNDLFGDLDDGEALLKIIDRVSPGIVMWRKVNHAPRSRFKKVENANYAVVLGKQLHFSLVNVGGVDICDRNKKLVLSIMWQLMRKHTVDMLAALATDGQTIDDAAIIAWANSRVQRSGKVNRISSFKDRSIANGVFLLDLCGAIEPRAINWELVQPGETEDDKTSNAKYAISIARKIGACIFVTPEDITEVKSKMIMTFVASLWTQDLVLQRQGASGAQESKA